MAQANVVNITDWTEYQKKLASAYSSLEGDICDLERMARLTAIHVEDFLTDARKEMPTEEGIELAMFVIYETLDKAAALKRSWYERHAAAD